MQRAAVLFLAFVAIAESLTCRTCDSYISCSKEMIELCPPYTKCYTITKNGQVTNKGCTASCSSNPLVTGDSKCITCDEFDNCNDVKNIDQPRRSPWKRNIGSGVSLERGIGHGVQEHSNGNIGQGVQTSFGIGSGVSESNGGIGHGVVENSGMRNKINEKNTGSRNHRGIGEGVMRNRQPHNSIGQGVSGARHGIGYGVGNGEQIHVGGNVRP